MQLHKSMDLGSSSNDLTMTKSNSSDMAID